MRSLTKIIVALTRQQLAPPAGPITHALSICSSPCLFMQRRMHLFRIYFNALVIFDRLGRSRFSESLFWHTLAEAEATNLPISS